MNIFPHKTIFAANLQQNFEMCKIFSKKSGLSLLKRALIC